MVLLMVTSNASALPHGRAKLSRRTRFSLNSLLLDSITNPVVIVSRQGKVLRINSYLAELVGVPQQGNEGTKAFHRLLPSSSWQKARQLLVKTFVGDAPSDCIIPVVNVDGVECEISWQGTRCEGKTPEEDIALLTGVDLTERRRLQRAILSIANTVQQQVSQDLHDTVCQEVAGVRLLAQVVAQGLASFEEHDDGERAKVAVLRHWARQLIDESSVAIEHARSVSHGLSPTAVTAHDVPALLAEQVNLMNDLGGAVYHYACNVSLKALGDERAHQLYMIAREAMANAAKHSKARHVLVDLRLVRRSVVLRVADDGVGWNADGDSLGIGMDLMRHRADLVGARLKVRSQRNRGTCIFCKCRC